MPLWSGAFSGDADTAFASYCGVCKHWRGNGRCAAFPRGVPEKILTCETDHRYPFPGDGGLRYDGPEEEISEMLARAARFRESVRRFRES